MDAEIVKYLAILEGKKEKLSLNPLPYSTSDLNPVLSKETLNYHFKHLAQAYVDRFNKGEGDAKFNKAGAFLHNILFAQFQPPKSNNHPTGVASEFITKKFKTFDKFKEEFTKVAMGIQGSGWVYLARDGKIKTITNHEIKTDIVLLIDWWEHAWSLDYQHDKKKYLENQWKIINWNAISSTIGLAS